MAQPLAKSEVKPEARQEAKQATDAATEKVLDAEQIRQYRRDGFVVVNGVLSAQMVELCNAACPTSPRVESPRPRPISISRRVKMSPASAQKTRN